MKGLATEFKQFAIRGNMIDIAIGIIVGTYFNKVIDVMVKKVILPPFHMMSSGGYLSEQKVVLRAAKGSAAEVSVMYGEFAEAFIDFSVIGLTLFAVVKVMNKLRHRAEDIDDKRVETPKDIELLSDVKKLLIEQNKLLKNDNT